MSKYYNKFPFNIYEKMFVEQTGSSLNEEEIEYLLKFTDQNNYLNSSMELYTYSLFLLKRYYPLFMVKKLTILKTKKLLKSTNAPVSIQILYKEISLVVVISSIANYGKTKYIVKG